MQSDLAELEQMDAEYVFLDTYMDDPEATKQHELAWQMITSLATQVLDLARENLRWVWAAKLIRRYRSDSLRV